MQLARLAIAIGGEIGYILLRLRYKLYLSKFYFMETATILGILIAAALVGISALDIDTAFGPPAVELSDPFEDHED